MSDNEVVAFIVMAAFCLLGFIASIASRDDDES